MKLNLTRKELWRVDWALMRYADAIVKAGRGRWPKLTKDQVRTELKHVHAALDKIRTVPYGKPY